MFYRKQKTTVQYIVSWTKDVGFTISSKKMLAITFTRKILLPNMELHLKKNNLKIL